MYVALTALAARDLGRTLRFLRHGRNLTIHDASKRGGLSAGYLQNLESGVRSNVSEESYLRLAKAYDVSETVILDLLLKARIAAALERRGLTEEQRMIVWRGIETLLVAAGLPATTDIAAVVSGMLP